MLEPTENTSTADADPDALQRVLKVAFDLHHSGRHTDAEAVCRVLLPRLPNDSQLLLLFGMTLQKMGRSREALGYLELAAQLKPKSARILNSLGFVHQSLKNPARAMEFYAQAIGLGLGAADTYYSAGNACHQLGEVERAAGFFKKAVEIKPGDAASWNNLGKCLNDSNCLKEAVEAYDRALAIDPNYTLAGYGRATSLLAMGRLTEGFRAYNQWRFPDIKPRQFTQPEWQGESIPGGTLFLYAEQGFGDALQYIRFVPQIRERAGKVILECRPELKALFARCAGADVVIARGEAVPPFDCFTSLPSLPGILGVTLSTIPSQVPYVKISSAGQLPPAPAGQLKTGVVWAGSPAHHNDAARSLRLEQFAPILQVPGVAFYSLQLPVPPADEALFRSMANLRDLSGQLAGFLETASAVAELDLIITVDTSVAHLAGAMAKPVWTLIPFAPDWRWLMEREDTPWYPTMRLFRQQKRGQWQPVIARVVEALGHLTAQSASEVR